MYQSNIYQYLEELKETKLLICNDDKEATQIRDVAVLDNLEFFLQKLDIEENLLYKKPFELSGGQLQRCSILRALLMKPDLLLADEPTSALDNIIQLNVMKLLLQFLDQIGILLITHDLSLATWCSDNIYNLHTIKP